LQAHDERFKAKGSYELGEGVITTWHFSTCRV